MRRARVVLLGVVFLSASSLYTQEKQGPAVLGNLAAGQGTASGLTSAMSAAVIVAHWQGIFFLATLAITVTLKVAAGKISLNGLLTGDVRGGGTYFSLGRLQLLLVTILTAARYLKQLGTHLPLKTLPDVPTDAIRLLAFSQTMYLAGKARALHFGWRGSRTRERSSDQ